MIHPTVIDALDARQSYGAALIHPDPAVRASRAAAAWQVLCSPSPPPSELRGACHVLLWNATDPARRAAARRQLKEMGDPE